MKYMIQAIFIVVGLIFMLGGILMIFKDVSPNKLLIIGIFIVVLGTALGTFLIHDSNRKANTARIVALETTFTGQNKMLQDQTVLITEIANRLKDEQREKGSLKLKIGKYDGYFLSMGMVGHAIKADDLDNEYTGNINGFKYSLMIRNGELLISFFMKGENGKMIFLIEKGDWVLSRSVAFSINFDDHGLEIIGKKGENLLQVDVVGDRIHISGAFYNREGITLISRNSTEHVLYEDKYFKRKLDRHFNSLIPKFMHIGENYLGRRIKQ